MADPTHDRAWLAQQATECLRYIGGRYGLPCESVPSVGSWPRLRAELAGRNLGLIPVAKASNFHWPGYWLAGLVDGEQRSAAVMFGSPPATVWPASARGDVEVGFVLTPFDPSLPLLDPYASELVDTEGGAVVGLYLAAEARAPMRPADEAELIAGRGIECDRYATGRGSFQNARQVLDVQPDAEVVRRLLPEHASDIGVIAPQGSGTDPAFEVRAFYTDHDGDLREDPVTGSLNAAVAAWMLEAHPTAWVYTARQGTRLGRDGRLLAAIAPDGSTWLSGATTTVIEGTMHV